MRACVPVKIALFVLITYCTNAQGDPGYPGLDSIQNNFDSLFDNSRTWLLLMIRGLAYEKLNHTMDADSQDAYRPTITNLYIHYAASLLDEGFDPDFDYSTIVCYRWSVMGMFDTTIVDGRRGFRNLEIARLNNAYFCQKLRLYRDYLNFCNAFYQYFRNNYRKKKLKFTEIENLTQQFLLDDDRSKFKKVTWMLRKGMHTRK
ncbi:MAG: hypothetical protein IPP15_06490 [Saprospiraceae bacterium]|uniref:Uncharacterized protein n=1 Tax=Candidatus Opimibacter skivensis TaxID=2982028 RepID=A0A9D7SRP4_9BACT|nr:hypothetical protein [Candidatus Opimibacter skivensis]